MNIDVEKIMSRDVLKCDDSIDITVLNYTNNYHLYMVVGTIFLLYDKIANLTIPGVLRIKPMCSIKLYDVDVSELRPLFRSLLNIYEMVSLIILEIDTVDELIKYYNAIDIYSIRRFCFQVAPDVNVVIIPDYGGGFYVGCRVHNFKAGQSFVKDLAKFLPTKLTIGERLTLDFGDLRVAVKLCNYILMHASPKISILSAAEQVKLASTLKLYNANRVVIALLMSRLKRVDTSLQKLPTEAFYWIHTLLF